MGIEDYIERFETDANLEEKLEHVKSVYVHWRNFIRNKENYKIKEGMKNYEKLKGKEEYNESLYHASTYFLENLVSDFGDYVKILNECEELMNIYKFRSIDEDDYKSKVKGIDSRRRAVHSSIIHKIGIINRLLASELGLHDKIINNDAKNPYVGIYPNRPEHLYKNPKKDIEIGITQDLEKKDYAGYRAETSDTLVNLAYVIAKMSI
ncbi:MAG: hypothetical protein PWQ28_176 [Candidatus Woesearchaeota archaeon]|nr:hypothetical protein [Candidatus Woesearchaeota archaeon]